MLEYNRPALETGAMVLCAMVGCENQSERDRGKRFYRLPVIITHQEDKTHELSKRREGEWLARIKREDIKSDKLQYARVCSDHFMCEEPAKLYDCDNPDWVPSL